MHSAGAEAGELRRRRDRWILDLVRTKPRLGHLDESTWFDALDDDLPTLRATLRHLLVDEPSADGVVVAARLGPYWYFRSKTIEGRTWSERALHHEHRADPLAAALVRLTLAHTLASGGRADPAAPHRARAAALLDGTAHALSPVIAEVHVLLTHSLLIAGDVEQARDVARQVAAAADATADSELRLLADTCVILDDGATGRGTVADLAALHARAERLGNVHVALLAAGVAIMAAIRQGDLTAGLTWSDRMIAHRLVLGTSDGPVAFELRAVVTALLGDAREAVRLFAAARTQALRNGLRWPAVAQTSTLLEQVTGALPAEDAEQARAEGARLDLAALVREPRPPAPAATA